MKVLIADDSETIREHFSDLLQQNGFDVSQASSGDEALEVIVRDPSFELIILDCHMPGLQGADVCRKIRELQRQKYTYIVLFTASGRSQDIVSGLEAGADDFILKSCSAEELVARLNAGSRVIKLHNKLLADVHRRSQSQRLESLGHISTGLAHQLNTPTQYVIHNMEFLREEVRKILLLLEESTLSPEMCSEREFWLKELPSCIEQNIEGVHQIKDIVAALRDFSLPPAVQKSPFEMNSVVKNVLAILGEAGTEGTTIALDLTPASTKVYGFQDDINHILLHLIVNAREAVRVGACAAAGVVRVKTESCGQCVHVAISDNGRRMAEEEITLAFDPFSGASGLYFAKSSIEGRNGGRIWLECGEQSGTTVHFELPATA